MTPAGPSVGVFCFTLHSWAFYLPERDDSLQGGDGGHSVKIVNPVYTSKPASAVIVEKANRSGIRFKVQRVRIHHPR